MDVRLVEVTDANRAEIVALQVAPEQEPFVSTVAEALTEAAEWPQANPWYRAVYDGTRPIGFVMLSWDVTPQPPDVIGPWFLWKLLVDRRYQGRGYGAETVRQVCDLIRREGATELLTSYVDEPGGPAGFYTRLGFVPTGEYDDGETITGLPLTS